MDSELSDNEIIKQVRAGQVNAYATLVQRYQDRVYNLAYRMTGNHADATEQAHDAFVKAYQKLDTFKEEYSFGNWVLSICANQSKNLFRSRARRAHVEQQHLETWGHANHGTPHTEERHEELSNALQQLPEKMRIAVTLKHVEACSYEEIAGILRIGISAAKMRVKRGIEHLTTMMASTTEAGNEYK